MNNKIWCGLGVEIEPKVEVTLSGVELKGYEILNKLKVKLK
jgi:hypothetical protein